MVKSHWLRQDLNLTKYGRFWYGGYEALNYMNFPYYNSLRQVQIEAISNNNIKFKKQIKEVNDFLSQLQFYYNKQSNSDDENDFFLTFLKKINSGFNINKFKKDENKIKFIIEYEQKILKFLDYIIRVSGEEEVPKDIEKNLKNMIQNLKEGDLKSFMREKALMWENLSVWILYLSGFQAINTGVIIDKGGKQLVEDAASFLRGQELKSNDGNFLNFQLRFTGTDSKKENKELFEYLKKVSKKDQRIISDSVQIGAKGYVSFQIETDFQGFDNFMADAFNKLNKKITIKVDNKFQEKLKESLTVQSKSGRKQPLLNNSERDLITTNQLVQWDSCLKNLYDFYSEEAHKSKFIKSDNLAIYVNLVFSKNLAKTTLGKNQMFLSHHGYMTLDEIMMKKKLYFTLFPNPNTMKLIFTKKFRIEENLTK